MTVLALGGSDCEVLRDDWLGQPVNSLSSLAYLAAGVYVLGRDGPLAPAVALIGVGVGSVLYHGPMPSGAELVHDGSLVALVGTLLFAGWRRALPRPPMVAVVAATAGLAINLLTRTGAPLCRPQSYLQGHAAWHILTALAVAAWLTGRPARPASSEPACSSSR